MSSAERPSGLLPGRALRRTSWRVALGTWVVLVAVLVGLPWLDGVDPSTPSALPAPGSAPWWAVLATITLQGVALLGSRPWPRATPVAAAALALPLTLAGTGDLFSLTSGAVTVATFLAVLARPLGALVAPLSATALLVVADETLAALVGLGARLGPALTTGVLQAVGAVGVPLLVAAALGARRDAREARRQGSRAAEREQEALVRAAVADERTAMARELHDIAAHHLSGISVMAAAIERQIDTDPVRAKASVRLVREQSGAVLEDLRRLVGLLRTDTDASRGVHSLAGIPELVETSRRAGTPVELRVLSAPGVALGERVGPIAQLAAFRIVQESLANATRHAPGAPVTVEVDDRAPDATVVTVVNDAPDVPAPAGRRGFGLVGMRERADLVGATLAHGPTAAGGWQVRVRFAKEGRVDPPPAREEVVR
ncbi:sensor histidine kinase [Microlunatus flavus]|uniref:sensor histidine kinase n=1 Tax=Microlunatus flavus TaxID=1036181 RepID=UPI0011137882|nr:histidine kinase [Microlunatus flavus]